VIVAVVASERLPFRNPVQRFFASAATLTIFGVVAANLLCEHQYPACQILKGDVMTQKTVLSIGQCRPDQAAISHYLTSHFGARVLTADLPTEAYQLLSNQSIDLILVNRKLDADYSDGMEILQHLCTDKSTAEIPVMLVSNFAEWQEKAVAMGAIYGFGKAELNRPETKQRLSDVLQ